ncbi:MAG TPA: VWA domain-containing protein [Terracidiphilus sp.]
MTKRYLLLLLIPFGFCSNAGIRATAQDSGRILVKVNLVQLNVAVTDSKGRYISGLDPQSFLISEDKIPQKIATFEEGNGPTRSLIDDSPSSDSPLRQAAVKTAEPNQPPLNTPGQPPSSQLTGANVFILFDTSNYMYRGFAFAQDSIADFVRSLEDAGRIAFYSYSRDLSRSATLTSDRDQVLRGVRSTIAGDDAALYNCLLLTVKDTAQYTGRKVIVVFSNGPDNASLVPPEDVAELAQSTGTIIYMISTQAAQAEPVSTAVFERMSKATGGKAYFAKSWRDEARAFASIRDDLAHLYTLSYYPAANPNRGWRRITVKLEGKDLEKYRVRTRDGYRLLQQAQLSSGLPPVSATEGEPK